MMPDRLPQPPNPMRPFVDGSYIVGQTQNSNFCAGIYCHTYLSVMIKDGTTYRLYDGWWDISALPNVQYYGAQLVEGTHSYKTSVHDFVTVAGSCGASSRTFYGKTYKRFSCEGATTTYMRIYTSTSRTVFFDD